MALSKGGYFMNIWNRLLRGFLCIFFVFTLSGCETSVSLTFQIENGDKIKVTLDTTDGYKLSEEQGKIYIKKDDKMILGGYFLTEQGYEDKLNVVLSTSESEVKILDKQPENLLYQFVGEMGLETIRIMKIEDSHTGILIGGFEAEEEVKAAMDSLIFESIK